MTVLCVNSTVVYADIAAADAAEGGIDYGVPTRFEQTGTSSSSVVFSGGDYSSGYIYTATSGEETTGVDGVGAEMTANMTMGGVGTVSDLQTRSIVMGSGATPSILRCMVDGLATQDPLVGSVPPWTCFIEGNVIFNCSDGFRINTTINDGAICKNNTVVDASGFGVLRYRAVDTVCLNTGSAAYLNEGASSSNYWADDGTGSDAITEGTPTDIFENYATGDYRIKATSSAGVAGAGAFIQGSGGVTVTALLNSNYMVEYSMKKNVASQSIGAQMVTISDGSDFTGTVTAEVTIDNGTKTAGGGSVTHEGEGYHSYAPTQAETNGDHIAVSFAGTGALTQTIQVYTTFPQTVDNAAGIADIPTVAEFNARTLASADYFDPAADTVANVTLVATTTTNTDMVGTNGANTVVPPSVAQFNARTVVSADYFLVTDYTAPDNVGITQTQADIAALNDISVSQILTTQMTESYATDGVAPTLAQSLFLTMQNLQDYTYIGTTQTVKKIDGRATAATYTLDDAINPTSKTRAT